MAEYGHNVITEELAQQYLDELNAIDDGGISKNHLIGSAAWWPVVVMKPDPAAGSNRIPDDATVPDPTYNIKARFDATLMAWVPAPPDYVSTNERDRTKDKDNSEV